MIRLPTPLWLARAVTRLLLAQPTVRLLSLGGGPGFDAAAVALAAAYCHSPDAHLLGTPSETAPSTPGRRAAASSTPGESLAVDEAARPSPEPNGATSSPRSPGTPAAAKVDADVLDLEAGWGECALSLEAAANAVLGSSGGSGGGGSRNGASAAASSPLELRFGFADITKGLDDQANKRVRDALGMDSTRVRPSSERSHGSSHGSPRFVVCAHAVAENANALRGSNYALLQAVCAALQPGSVLIFTEATHRQWPDVVLAAFRSLTGGEPTGGEPADRLRAACFSFDVAFPQVPGKRGYALVLAKRRARMPANLTGLALASRGAVRDFVDLEHVVGGEEWALLKRFKTDSDRHDLRAREKTEGGGE